RSTTPGCPDHGRDVAGDPAAHVDLTGDRLAYCLPHGGCGRSVESYRPSHGNRDRSGRRGSTPFLVGCHADYYFLHVVGLVALRGYRHSAGDYSAGSHPGYPTVRVPRATDA